VVCQFTNFQGNDPELASPVLERVCKKGHDHGAAGGDGAATKQRSSPDDRDVSAEAQGQPIASDP
jgi:hypothetical protein